MKSFTIDQILTEAEIDLAMRLKDRVRVREEILRPNMARINQALGQENDVDYLAYAVEYVMTQAKAW